ncbi:MAG: alpha/beta hydrolase [Clostridia bacterium]|nr:alpha/beta hydrolase [Clostridia bacterium]MBQ7296640.1 alpha/beta hydrolase [Clostridia bacterium]
MKNFLKVTSCLALSVIIGAGVWQIYVRQASKDYNLITLDEPDIAPVATQAVEADIELSEITMHYAVYGDEGYPLILVHGNGGDKNSLKEAAEYLANDYKVYVIESRCHGQSSNADKISYDLMAKDIKEFIEAMGLEKPYLMGHSDGGINALTVAYTYPDLLGAFISCGANTTPDTFKPYFPLGVRAMNLIKPDKLNDMMLTLPQMNAELLSKITCPAYIVAGEYDIMWLSDSVFIHECIPHSKIAIIKGANHSSYISQNGKQAYTLAKEFFGSLG